MDRLFEVSHAVLFQDVFGKTHTIAQAICLPLKSVAPMHQEQAKLQTHDFAPRLQTPTPTPSPSPSMAFSLATHQSPFRRSDGRHLRRLKKCPCSCSHSFPFRALFSFHDPQASRPVNECCTDRSPGGSFHRPLNRGDQEKAPWSFTSFLGSSDNLS
jgi:hypothetical protein